MPKRKSGGGKAVLEWYGLDDYVKRLDEAGKDMSKVFRKAMVESAKIPAEEMKEFVSQGQHYEEGFTVNSMIDPESAEITEKNGVISMTVGFKVKNVKIGADGSINKKNIKSGNTRDDGGLASIFLNLGGLHNPPYYFIDKAVGDNVNKIAQVQNDVLVKFLNGVFS